MKQCVIQKGKVKERNLSVNKNLKSVACSTPATMAQLNKTNHSLTSEAT